MKGLFWVGLFGFAFGLMVAPKKGIELRKEIKAQGNSVFDTIFYLVALMMEAPKPRQEVKMPDAGKKFADTSDEERQAAKTMYRIKTALDDNNNGNHKQQVAS